MNVSDERTVSLWASTAVAPEAAPLTSNATVDVVIVGSGIAGLSTAYELTAAGATVAVLDRGAIGSGMTARTTAHLASICDDYFSELGKRRGEDLARLYYESQSKAIDRIEAIVEAENIACDFRRLDGMLFPASGRAEDVIERELEAGRNAGVMVEERMGAPFTGFERAPTLAYGNQGTFHPLKYLHGLAEAIASRAGTLYADTTVTKVIDGEDEVRVETESGGMVTAKHAVVATNSPINDRVALHTKQAPYRTYAMAFQIARDALPDALYWDTADPYHYVRLQPGDGDTDFLIVGGEDHKTGAADDGADRFARLAAWAKLLVPSVGAETHRWSGQVMETIDFAGFIGRNPGSKRTYVATGDSGQGITHGAVAGILISDLILKGESPWEKLYEPSRKTPGGVGKFVAENVTAIKSFAEYVAPGEIDSVEKLAPGTGAILREGTNKIAAYRDETGHLYKRSAACTHIGCHVHWNTLERCWDCPCHGSQFAVDGTALNAPAIKPLASLP